MERWLRMSNRKGSVAISKLPRLSYPELYEDMREALANKHRHCAAYFGRRCDEGLLLIAILLDDASGSVYLGSYLHEDQGPACVLPALSTDYPAMHCFEREITENFGVVFEGNPWNKPLRFSHDRADRSRTINNYPFYTMSGKALHEVNVGPIHAGIIEPGVFRFICNGEQVLHLEIALGYQHRGVERLMRESQNRLRQVTLAESIAADSTIAHTSAYVEVVEKLSMMSSEKESLARERIAALELERIAMHLADTGALCMDIGFQLGQVACEALRTLVINSTQFWCGNRFGKGLIRPFGSHFPLTKQVQEVILENLQEVERRYAEVVHCLRVSPSVLARFEDCGVVTLAQSIRCGIVGMAARASGNVRDIRTSHPWGIYGVELRHTPIVQEEGDVMARLNVRMEEVQQSILYIRKLFQNNPETWNFLPDYQTTLYPNQLAFSLLEGWRGEICHVATTDASGALDYYKVKDPSMHNWLGLALAVRDEGISDFPICNKSFNLSYCGHDL